MRCVLSDGSDATFVASPMWWDPPTYDSTLSQVSPLCFWCRSLSCRVIHLIALISSSQHPFRPRVVFLTPKCAYARGRWKVLFFLSTAP